MFGIRESIQGKWTPDLWNQDPKHELEKQVVLPLFIEDMTPFHKSKRPDEMENTNEDSKLINSGPTDPTILHRRL